MSQFQYGLLDMAGHFIVRALAWVRKMELKI